MNARTFIHTHTHMYTHMNAHTHTHTHTVSLYRLVSQEESPILLYMFLQCYVSIPIVYASPSIQSVNAAIYQSGLHCLAQQEVLALIDQTSKSPAQVSPVLLGYLSI